MVQRRKVIEGSVNNYFKVLYAVGVGGNFFVAVAHIVYAIVMYDTVDESALWFVSGALAFIFNGVLNLLCLRECTRLNYITGMIANIALLVFCVVLAIIVREGQTVLVAIIVFYTTVVCYCHNNRHIPKRNFDHVGTPL